MAVKINNRLVGETPEEQFKLEKSRFNKKKCQKNNNQKIKSQTTIYYEH